MNTKSLCVLFLLASLERSARAETIFGATCDSLFRFDSATPAIVDWEIPFVGLEAGECIDGLDFDPRSGLLYGHSHFECQFLCPPFNETKMFVVDPESGTVIDFWGDDGLSGVFAVGDFDVIPGTGEIRMIGNAGGFNMRLDPLAAHVAFDTPLAPVRPIAGVAHRIESVPDGGTETYGVAYTGDLAPPLDLVRIGGPGGWPPAATGELSVIGPVGIDLGLVTGFDISPTGAAYLSAFGSSARAARERGSGWGPSHLYAIELTTGAATDLGEVPVPNGTYLSAIAAGAPRGPVSIPALGLTGEGLFVALLALSATSILRRRLRPPGEVPADCRHSTLLSRHSETSSHEGA